jgi:phosphoglycerol transferase
MIHPISFIAKSEWRTGLLLAILSFIAASLLMSGYPLGITPELNVPFNYGGDGLAYLWNVQRAIEGIWYFENERSGFPFGSNHLDYPTSDTGTYLALKLLGWLFESTASVMNLYYLLGFSLCSFFGYLTSRSMGVTKYISIATALLYSFASFHFGRVGHLFFTWYFVAPLFFYIGFRLFSNKFIFTNPDTKTKNKIINAAGLIFLASFGIYYALFGCFVVGICTAMASALQRSWQRLYEGLLSVVFIVIGVLLNVMPSLIYIFQKGENREGVNRLAGESELYALKITQMLLPRADHRLDSFFEFASRYNNAFPHVTENISASLGLIGSVGFLLLVVTLIFSLTTPLKSLLIPTLNQDDSGRLGTYHMRMRILMILTLCLVLIGTVGGGSSLFALLISTSIRSWNRISIFIAFISVLALMLSVDYLVIKYIKPHYSKFVGVGLACVFLAIGLYDQTAKPCHTCMRLNRSLIENDAAFVRSIETSLPNGSAIYQLPYMAYPESNAVNSLGSYDQARGLLNSLQLKWSFGGMRGRAGDWFFRKLSHLPIHQQITVIKAMGFSGIYIDRRGYIGTQGSKRCAPFMENKSDRIKHDCLTIVELEQDIADSLGINISQQKLISNDAQLLFIPLQEKGRTMQTVARSSISDALLIDNYLKPIGFKLENGIPIQIEDGYDLPLDFRKGNLDFPHYVGNVTGLSGYTVVNGVNEGRYSDAIEAKRVTIWFSKPLPKKFTLQLRAEAAGPNVGKPLKVTVGRQSKELIFSNTFSTQTVAFETNGTNYKMEFIPAEPFSPSRRWGAADTRLLAVNFQQLTIKPE